VNHGKAEEILGKIQARDGSDDDGCEPVYQANRHRCGNSRQRVESVVPGATAGWGESLSRPAGCGATMEREPRLKWMCLIISKDFTYNRQRRHSHTEGLPPKVYAEQCLKLLN